MNPWEDPKTPRWIRQRRLWNAANAHGDKFISLKRDEYINSTKRAAAERDAFYSRHEKEMLYAKNTKKRLEQMELFP